MRTPDDITTAWVRMGRLHVQTSPRTPSNLDPEHRRDDNLRRLVLLAELAAVVDAETRATVADLRPRVSWGKIGAALGVTKQAAVKRFGEKRPAHVETGPGLF